MLLLGHRTLLAIAAVVDVAVHSRRRPVAAKALAARHDLPPRHLETLLQALVHANILKGVRGPMGGYELAQERRRVSVADIVRAVGEDAVLPEATPGLVAGVIAPMVDLAGRGFLAELGQVSVHDLCVKAGEQGIFGTAAADADFHI